MLNLLIFNFIPYACRHYRFSSLTYASLFDACSQLFKFIFFIKFATPLLDLIVEFGYKMPQMDWIRLIINFKLNNLRRALLN